MRCRNLLSSHKNRIFKELINTDTSLFFSGSYVDAGITGTKAEVRPELQRLISDCKAGKIDLIVTKSISRFSRNTEDCLGLVRLLSSFGISIHFEKEHIFTAPYGCASSDFILSLLSWFAEYESGSISGNVKWSILKKFQEGTYRQAQVP